MSFSDSESTALACLGVLKHCGLRLCLSGAVLMASFFASGLAQAESPDQNWKTIKGIIDEQSAAWNEGSIDGFMKHYWRSEQLTFSAGGKTTRGWKATRDRYKRRYQTPEQMGKLRFDKLEFTQLSDEAALVLGRWQLTKKTELVGGNFSIVFRRMTGKWVIIHDHSSTDETFGKPKATTPSND